MRTVRTKVYKFNELSDSAKQTAIEWYRNGENEYFGACEVLDSIKKGLLHFGAELTSYEIDWQNINGCSYKIDLGVSDEVEELKGVRLWKYLHNNNLLSYWNGYTKKTDKLLSGDCPFTGVCFDESFLDNIRSFIEKPNDTTFKELLEDAVYNTIKDGCNDWQAQQEDSYITDTILANDYEFTKDGNIFNK